MPAQDGKWIGVVESKTMNTECLYSYISQKEPKKEAPQI